MESEGDPGNGKEWDGLRDGHTPDKMRCRGGEGAIAGHD